MGTDWTLRQLMSDVIGSGPRSAADMTYEQARGAMRQILDGDFEPLTLGAFLVANRWKSNTPTELAGYVDELRAGLVSSHTPAPGTPVVDCGANYDGKSKTALLGVAAGLVSASAGAPTAVHAGAPIPMSYGQTYRDVLEALDVTAPVDPAASSDMLEQTGFGYWDQRGFQPELAALVELRGQAGVRTFINTIETLANPAHARIHLGSFYHLTFATRLIATARESRSLDFDRMVFVQGLEGYDDIRPGRCKIVEMRDGELSDFDVEPDGLGLNIDREQLGVDDVAADSARLTVEILEGQRRDVFRRAALLNAGLRIWAADVADTLEEAVELAEATLESGAPRQKLETLRSLS